MAQSKPRFDIDPSALVEKVAAQFRGLNMNEPGQWPLAPKVAAWVLTACAVLAVCWFALLSSAADELQAVRDREPVLKQDFRSKLTMAANLDEMRKQKLQVQEYVLQIERQLPGKAEMDALLSDINQAGLGRGLQFELFRPGQVEIKDYYAELPIAIRVSGRYHDIGAFAADVANLSRIVTLNNISIAPLPGKDAGGLLAMDATARTYRYLDPNEVQEQKKTAAAAAAVANKTGAKK